MLPGLEFAAKNLLRAGITLEEAHAATAIDPWFLDQLVLLNEIGERVRTAEILDPDADRLRRKAKARAWATLQRRHPDEFAAILRAQMGRLLQEEGRR